MIKIRPTKLHLLLIALAFCLSNATMGELLEHEHKVHFVHNTVHVHHTNGDHKLGGHGLGETEHRDVRNILSFDYLSGNTSVSQNVSLTLKHHLPLCFSLRLDNQIPWFTSKIFYHLPPDQYYSTRLYQLNATYLI
ncbi:MAG: hypothetical protein HUU09_08465 [Candidatus Jettenia caeni]|nr:hypothetical protein [Candidatus Jettenia sp. AMX1]MDL1938039.1 hypothetical protein [Candidatus Jettenia sp. AMX1]NUN23488.1 hypothetical protein [Candidatus Jettenia caeni]WKZ16696.1 MAG: hypothetical protein QY317_05160 [Candidatus Jettenia caeni]